MWVKQRARRDRWLVQQRGHRALVEAALGSADFHSWKSCVNVLTGRCRTQLPIGGRRVGARSGSLCGFAIACATAVADRTTRH
jgi:hypothetical protein